MTIELRHSFKTARSAEEGYALALDLERVVPCVEGGSVLGRSGDDAVEAQIEISMGVMSLAYVGLASIDSRDPEAHLVVVSVDSKEATGDGGAKATVEFSFSDGHGTMLTQARLSGTAMSMGEAIPTGILDEMIKDFIERFSALT